ncbi:CvpA family protein [Notoacmeibacter ruber]|uniref:CvpA family protein n=1 Tax=Notoacmeibacter ruber TaxID=2670375 RepID=A0A3L7JAZ9_9HYPH|nr:CvpA family protein [Notoacmeibacter ruber]RLQ87624.1 CvpA family protein [Notoacmeibacter ruber]
MTLLDGIFIVFTLVSALLAMVRGFSREVLSIASWIIAGIVAWIAYPFLSPYLLEPLGRQIYADLAAAAIIFLIVLIIVTIITMRIADFIIDSRAGALDRTLGFIYGVARGVVVLAVALLFFQWLVAGNPPEWVANAKCRAILDPVGEEIASLLPEDPERDLFDRFLDDEDDTEAQPGDEDATQN